MNDLDLRDTEYEGGLSPLTRYGTLNVSEARVPRKKRSRGNIAPSRVTARGYAPTDAGRSLASQGIASVKVTYADGTEETRTANSFRKGQSVDNRTRGTRRNTAPQSEMVRLAGIVGYLGDSNH